MSLNREVLITNSEDEYQRLVYELKVRREQLGISQQELAEILGCSVAKIQDFETIEETRFEFFWILMYAWSVKVTLLLSPFEGSPDLPDCRFMKAGFIEGDPALIAKEMFEGMSSFRSIDR